MLAWAIAEELHETGTGSLEADVALTFAVITDFKERSLVDEHRRLYEKFPGFRGVFYHPDYVGKGDY